MLHSQRLCCQEPVCCAVVHCGPPRAWIYLIYPGMGLYVCTDCTGVRTLCEWLGDACWTLTVTLATWDCFFQKYYLFKRWWQGDGVLFGKVYAAALMRWKQDPTEDKYHKSSVGLGFNTEWQNQPPPPQTHWQWYNYYSRGLVERALAGDWDVSTSQLNHLTLSAETYDNWSGAPEVQNDKS